MKNLLRTMVVIALALITFGMAWTSAARWEVVLLGVWVALGGVAVLAITLLLLHLLTRGRTTMIVNGNGRKDHVDL